MSPVQPYEMHPHWTYRLTAWIHRNLLRKRLTFFWGVYQQYGKINLMAYHRAADQGEYAIFKVHASAELNLENALKFRASLDDAIQRAEVMEKADADH